MTVRPYIQSTDIPLKILACFQMSGLREKNVDSPVDNYAKDGRPGAA